MKYLILLCTFTVLSLNLFSQNANCQTNKSEWYQDSVYIYTGNGTSWDLVFKYQIDERDSEGRITIAYHYVINTKTKTVWEPFFKYEYTYHSGEQINTFITKQWNSVDEVYEYQSTEIYNSDGLLAMEYGLSLDFNDPANTTGWQSSYTYNVNGKITQEYYQDWDGVAENWVNDQKYVYTYIGDTDIETLTTMMWTGSDWENNTLMTFAYSSGNEYQRLFQNWSGSAWVNNNRRIKQYNLEHQLIQLYTQYWVSDAWSNNQQVLYDYDENENINWETHQDWGTTFFENTSHYDRIFDENGNKTEEIYQIYTSDWENVNKKNWAYNSNNDKIEYLYYSWDVSVWKEGQKETYEYNENFDQTYYLAQDWQDLLKGWVNTNQTVQEYTVDYQPLTYNTYVWDNNTWVDHFYKQYTYENGNLTLYTTQYWNSGLSQWDNSQKDVTYWDSEGASILETTNQDIKIYPNPAINKISISTNKYKGHYYILTDIQGKQIQSGFLDNEITPVDISNLRSGIYFVNINKETYKIIKN